MRLDVGKKGAGKVHGIMEHMALLDPFFQHLSCISASQTACPLRGYGRAGTKNGHAVGDAEIEDRCWEKGSRKGAWDRATYGAMYGARYGHTSMLLRLGSPHRSQGSVHIGTRTRSTSNPGLGPRRRPRENETVTPSSARFEERCRPLRHRP